jgi:SAM-dependent methyltransferase
VQLRIGVDPVFILLRIPRAVVNRVRYRLHRLVSGDRACRSYNEFLVTAFDRRFGLETAKSDETARYQGDGQNSTFGNWYQASDLVTFRQMLRSLAIDAREFVFVDLGSGKGRMLVAAAEAGFRRIVGVEYSDDLHAVAERNVKTYLQRSRRRAEIQTLHADAADYEFPNERLVSFFFNSFLDPVLGVVLGKLHRSLEQRPRDVYILHNGPQWYPAITAVFEHRPWLEMISSGSGYAIYRAWSRRGAASGEGRPIMSNPTVTG